MRKYFSGSLSLIVLSFAVLVCCGSAYAQNNDLVIKKQTKQSPVKTGKVITVGDHGQLKGFDGLQMALNMAQDMDEIRIEKGIIVGAGLILAGDKVWKHGISISGGWDEMFKKKSNNPEDTTLDGGVKGDSGDGYPRTLTISKKVFIENIAFKNNKGGAVHGSATFTNCMFANNSDGGGGRMGAGGAVWGNGTFYNCVFMDNSAEQGNGGAVSGNGTFRNCTFTNNFAEDGGGAVSGNGTFHDCAFINNSASEGGAVAGIGVFNNCVFIKNSASHGGAVDSGFSGVQRGDIIPTFSNCVFAKNLASYGGAVNGPGTFINCTLYGNKAEEKGGAVNGGGSVLNSIFYKNTAGEKNNDLAAEANLKINFSLFNYLSGGGNVGENVAMGDPKFVDPDNGDLHLLPDSPCIGKGKRLPVLKDAKNINVKQETARKGVNMGADEAVLASVLENYKSIPEVIEDKKTGLMWIKDGASAGCNDKKTLDGDAAKAFCEGLTYAGYSGWRIPNEEELRGVLDDKSFQFNKTGDYWMASTDYAYATFNNGFISSAGKNENSYICCVRSAQ